MLTKFCMYLSNSSTVKMKSIMGNLPNTWLSSFFYLLPKTEHSWSLASSLSHSRRGHHLFSPLDRGQAIHGPFTKMTLTVPDVATNRLLLFFLGLDVLDHYWRNLVHKVFQLKALNVNCPFKKNLFHNGCCNMQII